MATEMEECLLRKDSMVLLQDQGIDEQNVSGEEGGAELYAKL